MDLTDAINIMTWSANDDTGFPGPVIWHIFPVEVSDKIREFLRAEGGFSGPGDPIHSQSVCLIPRWLARLEAKHRVRPYTIYQKPGDVVFIPAGCVHQVHQYHINLVIDTDSKARRWLTRQTQSKLCVISFLWIICQRRRSLCRSSALIVSRQDSEKMCFNSTTSPIMLGRTFRKSMSLSQ